MFQTSRSSFFIVAMEKFTSNNEPGFLLRVVALARRQDQQGKTRSRLLLRGASVSFVAGTRETG